MVHSKATTIVECEKFHGSKYVLSSMGQNYKEVENDLLSGKFLYNRYNLPWSTRKEIMGRLS